MVFAQLHLLYVLLPLILLLLYVRRRRNKTYFSHPFLLYLQRRIRPASPLVRLPGSLELLALGSLVLAVLEPTLPYGEHLIQKQGLDIVLVLDLSSSMQEPLDPRGAWERRRLGVIEKTRLDAVKGEMIRFVEKRQGDRIGVVVFSENSYVVAPLTADASYLAHYVRMVDHKTLASEGMTAIGEGILTAVSLLHQQSQAASGRGEKLIVVLTDGENNTGRDPFLALGKAHEAGFRVHMIGVDIEKAREAPRMITAVRATGGNYYDVRNGQELEQAYQEISKLEKGTFFIKERVEHVPRFYPFALASLLSLAASVGLRAIPYFIEIS